MNYRHTGIFPAPHQPRPAEPPLAQVEACVWIVEDETDLLAVIARAVRRGGHQVRMFRDADSAAAVLETGTWPDALITDLALPGRMNGLDLLREVLERTTRSVCILMTGHRIAPETCDGADDGRVACLEKPARLTDLQATLNRLLAQAA